MEKIMVMVMDQKDLKPDFLDLDKDGDKKNSMKKAAKKEEKRRDRVQLCKCIC